MPKEAPRPDTESRIRFIHDVQRMAMKFGRCKELLNSKCQYPHCGCLFGKEGPIDPETGKEYKEK